MLASSKVAISFIAAQGGAHNLKRNRAAAAFAEPHVEIKPWFHAKFRRRGTIADFI